MSDPDAPPPRSAEATQAPSPASPARPALLDRGDVVNLLGHLRSRLKDEGRKITTVQNRLIMKRLRAAGAWRSTDTNTTTPAQHLRSPGHQLRRIAAIVAEVVPMDAEEIEERLRACR